MFGISCVKYGSVFPPKVIATFISQLFFSQFSIAILYLAILRKKLELQNINKIANYKVRIARHKQNCEL